MQFSSVAQSCLTLCNTIDCNTPGLPVHHQLPEPAQIHVIQSNMNNEGYLLPSVHPQSVSLFSHSVFVTPWTAARQASLSITNSQSLLKLMSIESVMPSNHLILCHPLLLLPSTFPSIRVFSRKSALPISFSGGYSQPRDRTRVSCIGRQILC